MYAIVIKKSALKELAQIPPPYHKKILQVIDQLASTPRPEGVKKLKGEEAYRMRVAIIELSIQLKMLLKL